MPIEIAIPVLTKALTGIFTPLTLEAIKIFKEGNEKRNAERAAADFAKTIKNINTVKTMWSRDEGVLIDSFYHPPMLIKKSTEQVINDVEEITKETALIEGIVGQGKSIFLRHLCSSFLEQGKIPVFIELRMTSKKRSLENLILSFLEESGINGTTDVLNHLINNNKIALILDGFDEISLDMIQDTTYEIDHLQKKYSQLSIIISSRPYHAAHSLANFRTYSLSELDQNDYEPFLLKLIDNPVKRFEIVEAISGTTKNIKGVITTPLMLTLLVLVYESEKEIPATLPEFFDKLFGTVFTRHDKLKAGFERKNFSNLPESKIQKLFDSFCFMHMQSSGNRSVTSTQFTNSFEKALRYTYGIECELENFKKDITSVACLMLEEGLDQLSFLHKSIMEYHAASFIRGSSEEFAKKFYNHAPNDFYRWEAVLQFLRSIDSFRYGKFYILEEYPAELHDIDKALRERSKASLINYMDKKFPNLEVYTTNFGISGLSSTQQKNHSFKNKITHGIITTLIRQVLQDQSRLQKSIRATPQTQREGNQLLINTRAIVEHFEINDIFELLKMAKSEIEKDIKTYKNIVEIEQEKESIFN